MSEVLGNILPLFALVLVGYAAGRGGWITEGGAKGLSFFVFYLAVPALLFRTLGRADVMDALDPRVVLAYFSGTFMVMAVTLGVGQLAFGRRLEERAVMAMGAMYSNIVLLGIPLVYALFGEPGLLPMMMIVAVHSLVLLPLTVILIEAGRRSGDGGRGLSRAVFGAVFKNPVILSILAGIAFNLSGLELAGAVDRFAGMLGGASAPCALFALGATLSAYHVGGGLRESLTIVALKLVLHPALVWVMAAKVFALPPLWIAVATVTAALPTGVNVFIMAHQYNLYLARTTAAVLISTALSAATVTGLVLLLAPVP